MPGDPNCAFYWKGRYHLHYIYNHPAGFAFAHLSSEDLVHWTWHPTTLHPETTGHGMFSGTGFITKDGRPAIIYHGQGSGRNQLAFSLDENGVQSLPRELELPADGILRIKPFRTGERPVRTQEGRRPHLAGIPG